MLHWRPGHFVGRRAYVLASSYGSSTDAINWPPAMVDAAAVAFFQEHGYLTVEDVISPTEVAELQAVADGWVEASRGETEHTELFDLEPTHSAEYPQVRRVKNPGRHSAFAGAHTLGIHRLCGRP